MRKILLWAGAGFGSLVFFMALLVVGVYGAAAGLLGGGGGRGGGQLATNSVPAEYAALVQQWGNLCPTLSPALLAAQLNQESGFRTDRTSPANAQGIAQFIPGTWATHGMDANNDGVADVWDPEDAIPSAASYDCSLAGYVDDVPGDPVDNMLAAYNAGPYAVIQYGGVPPYTETQNYVPALGLAGCLVLAFALPPASVLAGASVLAAGAAGYLVRRRVA
ncbi:lytic transglycosylase domain-containing protein, partial [Streptomyces hainanensis]